MNSTPPISFFNEQNFYHTLETTGQMSVRQMVSNLVLFDETESTSSELMSRINAGAPAQMVMIAARQTGGRGRSGNSWHSDHDGNLYISYAIEITGDIVMLLPMVPLAAGVAAFEALNREGIDDVQLKWPNDLMLNERKVGGILCETPGIGKSSAIAIVGMGVNIGEQTFPVELQQIAQYLVPPGDALTFRERFAACFVESLYRWCQTIQSGGVASLVARWRQCCEPFGRHVRVGQVTGYTVDLNDEGRLLLRTDDGEICTIPGGMVTYLNED